MSVFNLKVCRYTKVTLEWKDERFVINNESTFSCNGQKETEGICNICCFLIILILIVIFLILDMTTDYCRFF